MEQYKVINKIQEAMEQCKWGGSGDVKIDEADQLQ